MAEATQMEKEEKGFIAQFGFWVAVGFVVVAMYVMSTGPVIRMLEGPGGSPSPTVLAIYAPLVWMSEHSRRFESFMDWYVKEVWHAGQ